MLINANGFECTICGCRYTTLEHLESGMIICDDCHTERKYGGFTGRKPLDENLDEYRRMKHEQEQD